jgi:uncharacterized protein YjbI with pentapeptide repeats
VTVIIKSAEEPSLVTFAEASMNTMNSRPTPAERATVKAFDPSHLRRRRPESSAAARRARALRPALETCEPRTLLSAGAADSVQQTFEPLQFSAVTVSQAGQTVPLFGTLDLNSGPGGELTGSLVQAEGSTPAIVRHGPLAAQGHTLAVKGSLRGQQMTLDIRTAPGHWVKWKGPVVSAKMADGQTTLHGGGVLTGGNHTAGTFTLQGSSVVLPTEQLQKPSAVKRVIPAGTTLVSTEFLGQVTQGPDTGLALRGLLSLGRVARDGSFAGTLADPIHGTVPVSGRVVGQRIQLIFDLGAKGTAGGIGPFQAQRVGPGQVKLTAFGSLQTGNPGDSGDWALANSALNGRNLSNQTGYVLSQNSVYLTGTNFSGTTFSNAVLTLSQVDQSVNFQNADFSAVPLGAHFNKTSFVGVNFSGANLTGANLNTANLTGANLTSTILIGANLTDATLTGADLTGAILANQGTQDTNLTGTVLTGVNLTDAYLAGENLSADNLTGTNLSGAILTGVNLHGTNLTNGSLVGTNLAGLGLSNANLSGAKLTGANLVGADLSYANLTGANLTGASLANNGTQVTNLTGTVFNGANLTNANLTGLNLAGFNFTGVNLNGATLTGANLFNINLYQGSLAGTNLAGLNLSAADLNAAVLVGANLSGANLTNAGLAGAKLADANLSGANLTNAVLAAADFSGANLTGTGLTAAYLTSHDATYDSTTIF